MGPAWGAVLCKATAWNGVFNGNYGSIVEYKMKDGKKFKLKSWKTFKSFGWSSTVCNCKDAPLGDVTGYINQMEATKSS